MLQTNIGLCLGLILVIVSLYFMLLKIDAEMQFVKNVFGIISFGFGMLCLWQTFENPKFNFAIFLGWFLIIAIYNAIEHKIKINQ